MHLACGVLTLAIFATGCHEELGVGEAADERIEVESLTLEGVDAVDESRLRSALATQSSSWLPWGRERYFDREAFQTDLRRIEAFYSDRGYPNASIVSTDIDVDASGHSVDLTVAIDEGRPVTTAAVDLIDFDAVPEDAREALREELTLTPGKPLDQLVLAESRELAVNVLQNHGYPFAQVEVERVPVGEYAERVILNARLGAIGYFGPIEIVGNRTVGDAIVRRQLVYQPGDVFSRRKVQESLRRLYSLELFEFVNVEIVEGDPASAEVRTRVTVTEGDHREILLSGGYGTEEHLRGEIEWRHLNFLGDARTLSLHGKWSSLDNGAEGTLVQPYFFAPELSLSVNGRAWFVDEPAFHALTRGGRATLTRSFGPRSTVSATFATEFQRSQIANEALTDLTVRDELIAIGLNPTTGVQDGILSVVSLNAAWQNVENVLDPREGVGASLNLEQAGGWLPGTYNYLGAIGESRAYVSPHDRFTFAGMVRYGTMAPFDRPSDVPFFKRFFLGGASSLRGWGRYEVAPLSRSGLPLGGNSMFELSAEVRTRPFEKLGLVAFLDAGNVWANAWAFKPSALLYDAGPGVRYDTPIGALRLDFAYQLNRLEGLRIDGEPQKRPWRVHFSIGQAF